MARTYLKMVLNNAWSNATLWTAVQKLDPEAFTAKRPGFCPSVAETLAHVLEVDLYYIDGLEQGGKGRAIFFDDYPTDPASLAKMQADADMRLASFCNQIGHKGLDSLVALDRRDGIKHEVTGDLLLHLFQHQIHHRGQAHVQLSHAGHTPPQLDEFYLTGDRAPSADAYWT
ncbi:MAG: nuclease [Rhodobacteraceae bacterium]|nr:nuclease [Paracoccaceae bacterium]